MLRRSVVSIFALLAILLGPSIARADFGLEEGETTFSTAERDGTVASQAGSHPFSFTLHFKLNVDQVEVTEGGQMRDAVITLPPGFIGNPQAVPPCPRQSFEGFSAQCPVSTQIGVLRALLPGIGQVDGPLFNLAPDPGVAGVLGFNVGEFTSLQYASVLTDEGYGLRVAAPDLPLEATEVEATIWGVPADPEHDPERGEGGGKTTDAAELPFLTLPTSCQEPPEMTVEVDSQLAPGDFVGEMVPLRDNGGNPVTLTGCEAVPFTPQIEAGPSTAAAESSAGLRFKLSLPNLGLWNPKEGTITETEPETTEVVLPPGITANPSVASGLGACTLHQYESATAASGPGQGCPDSSKIGTLVATTPLLKEPIEGSVYVATPRENPFGSLLALYIVAAAPQRGVVVKQAGEVIADPVTGQLTSIFHELPPIPYSSFEVRLREGPRAPLITPQTCGEYRTIVNLDPFSDPGFPVESTAPFTVSSGANGSGCAETESQLPAKPSLEAGTAAPVAGAYSPFVFRVKRGDGEQRFSSIAATLPTGLLGKLKGVPYCPEDGIALAASRTQEGGGAEELASPSCPPASQVGVVNVSAGAGPSPYYTQGKAYLAGPYKGAPLSLEIITPAVAGPFDLGSVAVRTPLSVGLFDAQIHAQSDPLPTILHGIPLDVRTISLQMDRPEFTLNPTNCQAKTIAGGLLTLSGQSASLASPFAVGGCKGLEFKPKLKISLKGPTKRTGHPALKAVLTYPKGSGYANIARAQVELPASEFLDQGHIGTVCTQPQLKSQSCPKASIYGRAKAYTPLLDEPLTGPVYLGAGFGHKLPDLVADLNGQIRVLAHGKVDTGKRHGLRNTFEAVPDAPVSRFVLEMKGGKKGLLVNSTNICKGSHKAEVKLNAQNGKVSKFNIAVKADCGKKGKKKHRARRGHSRRH